MPVGAFHPQSFCEGVMVFYGGWVVVGSEEKGKISKARHKFSAILS
jgi:hypothetical protein